MTSTTMNFIDHAQGGAPEVLVLSKTQVPQPSAGEILIRVAYSGVNRPDCSQRLGKYPPPAGASPIIGLEASGEVVALGEGITRWKLGDRVCALTNGGSYAEYVCAPQGQVLPIPKGMTLLEAASLPENYFTVWTNVFEYGGLKADEHFLVHGGSSGIGLAAIQLAHAFKARVICTVGNDKKVQVCQQMGADLAVNYKIQDFVQEAKTFTQGRGVDMILDMVGGDYMQRNLSALALKGRLLQIAFLQGSKKEVDWVSMISKRLTFVGSTLRPRSAAEKAKIASELLQHVWPLFESSQVKTLIHEVYDLSDAAKAHALMESSAHIGKIMLKVAGE
ncbi:MAG: NAD(P)H-quinone oxidoreductase [Betaproteobacteria bacterium]|jgi:NADPH2:quinone reductase|nr:NAD(P)H-quinone oxidoreductase [Betaproteobacteria bacterium]